MVWINKKFFLYNLNKRTQKRGGAKGPSAPPLCTPIQSFILRGEKVERGKGGNGKEKGEAGKEGVGER